MNADDHFSNTRVLELSNIHEHRQKPTYASLHVSTPYEFLITVNLTTLKTCNCPSHVPLIAVSRRKT